MKNQEQANSNHEFWVLAGRVLSGAGSKEDHASLMKMLLHKEDLMERYFFLKNHWHLIEELEVFSHIHTENDWLRVKHKIETRRKLSTANNGDKIRIRPIYSVFKQKLPYAAAIAIFIVSGIFLYNQYFLGKDVIDQPVNVMTEFGSKARVNLPDGSVVWLNAGSELTYDPGFNKKNRDVRLQGEGFFDVNNGVFPFVVHTDKMKLTALGTSFNIHAYASDIVSTSTLLTGRLKVELTHPVINHEDIMMYPGSIIEVERSEKGSYTYRMSETRHPETMVAWKKGIIHVDNKSLRELAVTLSRQYNVSFVFADEEAKEYLYSGQLKSLSLEQIMNALKLTSPIDFYIDEDTVHVSQDPKAKERYH